MARKTRRMPRRRPATPAAAVAAAGPRHRSTRGTASVVDRTLPEVPPEDRFTLLPVRGIENTSQAFRDTVVQMAARLGTNPNFLMAVMCFETGGSFSPSILNQGGSGAVGLIQFMPATANGLGTSTGALAAMTAEAQLEFVEKHFTRFKGRLNTIEDTYMAVLLPKAVGKGGHFVLFQHPGVAFTQNKGLDADGDGRITVFDASFQVRHLLGAAGGGTGQILRRGSSGPEVETLQDDLIGLGHLRPEEKAGGPGVFGPRTERAVKDLQSANTLSPSGVVDSGTRGVMRQLNEGLGISSHGGAVAALQQRLVTIGNMTNAQAAAASATFDLITEIALRQFQVQHGLAATGILTIPTYRALLTAVPVKPLLVPTSGSAIDTVLPEVGRGFATFNREPGGADQFGLATTILAIRTLGAAWAETHTAPIFVGDISRRGGGPFPPHSSHKDGRDVDLRPFRQNGEPGPTNIHDPSYDHALTRQLVLLVRDRFPRVSILFNDPLLVRDGLTRRFAGHDNHLHVRFT